MSNTRVNTKIPKAHELAVTQTLQNGNKYFITRNDNKYYLWKETKSGVEKIKSANSPLKFDSLIK